jgi:hypothetical protein
VISILNEAEGRFTDCGLSGHGASR